MVQLAIDRMLIKGRIFLVRRPSEDPARPELRVLVLRPKLGAVRKARAGAAVRAIPAVGANPKRLRERLGMPT